MQRGSLTKDDVERFEGELGKLIVVKKALELAHDGSWVLRNNFVHTPNTLNASTQNDGLEMEGGTADVLIEGNRIANSLAEKSAILVENSNGAIDSTTARRNYLTGGEWTIYCDGRLSGNAMTDVGFTRNLIADWELGALASYPLCSPTFADNRNPNTGQNLDGTAPQCSNGIDDDSDGEIDWRPAIDTIVGDAECDSGNDNDESAGLVACADGSDNDGDGNADWPLDTDCIDAADSSEARAADNLTHYILQGGTGDRSGSAWNNALDALPATHQRGHTYYVGDGTYPGYTFDDAESGTTRIIIRKATALDHGNGTGWVSTYGDGQATFGALNYYTDYWVIDGKTGPPDWYTGRLSGYGSKVHGTGNVINMHQTSTKNADYVSIH